MLLAGAPGCAFVDLTVGPPPPASLTQPSSLGRGREVALMIPMTDARPSPARCGMQKNGYNMDTASVHCELPPATWMSQALVLGLTTAGFRVVRSIPGEKTEAPVEIVGTVLQFFVEPYVGVFTFTPEADISVKLVVTSASGLRAERVFYVKGTEESLLGTESNFQRAASSATKQAVAEMVRAIASLLDRYPASSGPPAAGPPVTLSLAASPEAAR